MYLKNKYTTDWQRHKKTFKPSSIKKIYIWTFGCEFPTIEAFERKDKLKVLAVFPFCELIEKDDIIPHLD